MRSEGSPGVLYEMPWLNAMEREPPVNSIGQSRRERNCALAIRFCALWRHSGGSPSRCRLSYSPGVGRRCSLGQTRFSGDRRGLGENRCQQPQQRREFGQRGSFGPTHEHDPGPGAFEDGVQYER